MPSLSTRCLVITTFFVLCLSWISPSFSENTTQKIVLTGQWKIHFGDDPLWATQDYDDSTWDIIDLPGSYARYSVEHKAGKEGYVWIRKKFFVPDGFHQEDMGIYLGVMAHADEAFFNGKKIGGEGHFPPSEISRWNFPRHYFVPRHVIKAGGVNSIAVKIWFHTYGDITGNLYISDVKSWEKDKDRTFFIRIIMNYVIIAMGIPLGILFSLFYIQRPRQTEYLYYSL